MSTETTETQIPTYITAYIALNITIVVKVLFRAGLWEASYNDSHFLNRLDII